MFLESRRYFIDIAFPHIKLAIEIDGRKHEEDHDPSSRTDGDRTLWSGMAGVFTREMLQKHPESSLPRFFRQLPSKTDTGLARGRTPACKIGAGVRK